jgi:hypothetical protein
MRRFHSVPGGNKHGGVVFEGDAGVVAQHEFHAVAVPARLEFERHDRRRRRIWRRRIRMIALQPFKIHMAEHARTLGQLLSANNVTWKYYTPGEGRLWTAPTAILSECGGSNQQRQIYTSCPGPEFTAPTPNVVLDPKLVLSDIGNCQLQSVNWVIPKGQYSDHAGLDTDRGPQWVANIVNAIGNSACTDGSATYWQDTAIVITWDDWGGWYDHEAPSMNLTLGYQLGFRVPLLFVSAYGPNNSNGQCNAFINSNDVLDFGSVANFVEQTFLGSSGMLGFADQRALDRGGVQDLSDFYNLNQQPCTFQPVGTQTNEQYFIQDQSPALPPDNDD